MLGLGEERHVLDDRRGVLEAVPAGGGAADAANRVLDAQHVGIGTGDVRLRGDDLADHAEAEVADLVDRAVDGIAVGLRGELAGLHQVRDDLVEVLVDALVHAEAQAQLHLEEEVGPEVVDAVGQRARLIGDLHVEEVIGLGALGALVQDRVEDVAVELVGARVVGHEDEVVGHQRQ